MSHSDKVWWGGLPHSGTQATCVLWLCLLWRSLFSQPGAQQTISVNFAGHTVSVTRTQLHCYGTKVDKPVAGLYEAETLFTKIWFANIWPKVLRRTGNRDDCTGHFHGPDLDVVDFLLTHSSKQELRHLSPAKALAVSVFFFFLKKRTSCLLNIDTMSTFHWKTSLVLN